MENNIGQIIKKHRLENNLKQEELAKLIGVDNTTISRWENDITIPDIYCLKKLCKAFNLSLDELIIDYKKPSKTSLIWLITSIIKLLIIIILSIKIINIDTSYYELTTTNKDITLIGNVIKQKNEYILNINEIQNNNQSLQTVIPEYFQISIATDDKIIETKRVENTDRDNLEELINNQKLYLKTKNKLNNLTIQIEYITDNNISKINIPLKYQ